MNLSPLAELHLPAYLLFVRLPQQVSSRPASRHLIRQTLHVYRYHSRAVAAGATYAFGIDTLQSIFPDRDPKSAAGAVGSVRRQKLQDAEDSFQSSDLLKRLKDQTTANSKK